MIKKYILERRSWITLVIALQFLIIFVSFIDASIPFLPILYIVFLSAIVFVLFLFYRYQKETRFYKSLLEYDHDFDLKKISNAESPFEVIVAESFLNQTEYLKEISSRKRVNLEDEKDEILSWIHEVKTPLTAMHLMIDRIENEKLKEELTFEWLRIHHLLDQQLHHKRIPFMENDLFIDETNLKEIIILEIKSLQSWCMQKGIGFDLNFQVTTVLCDAKWLSFIIRQLLTNAIKYSNSQDISIKTYQKNDNTILELRDRGRGIEPRDLPRIFEKGFTSTYFHEDRAATGMGLYLAKKAAETLFIQIDAQSELGKGTTFTLTFPKRNEFVHITGV